MATNDKGGSDLDIFEGLGSKGGRPPGASPGTNPPPPPPGGRPADAGKRTLMGITAPSTMPTPPPPSGGMPSSRPSRTPPPPPGRGQLPAVVAPPNKNSSVAPPAVRARPAGKAGPSVDMDWEDQDEATHIFDKGEDTPPKGTPAPMPAAGAAPPAKMKSTLLGLTAPMQPPPPSSQPPPARLTPPPPPPSVGSAFARASGGASGAPGPVSFPTSGSLKAPAVPSTPQSGLGLGLRGGSTPPPPTGGALPPPSLAGLRSRVPSTPEPTPPPPVRSMEATALVRPGQSRTGLWVFAALVIAVLFGVIYMVTPRTGRIIVNVSDAKGGNVNRLEVFVDGRKQCDTTPCIVSDQTAGAHDVKVLADGYDAPPVQAISVEWRKDSTANFTFGAASKGTGIRVNGAQAGVKLYVDDKESGPLPQELHDMTPGDHVIKVAGSERYQPLERHVSVEKDKVQDLGSITLKVVKGKATITLGTSGAKVYLVNGTDRRELPTLPISVDIDTAKTWALQATKTGYADYNQPVTFDDGQAEKTYVVILDTKSAATTQRYAPPAPVEGPVTAPSPDTGGGGGGEAFLTINSIPPSQCFLDGRPLGSTPKAHMSVKPGTHAVRFVNSDLGVTKVVTVTVGAGETKPAVAKLN